MMFDVFSAVMRMKVYNCCQTLFLPISKVLQSSLHQNTNFFSLNFFLTERLRLKGELIRFWCSKVKIQLDRKASFYN